MDSYGLGQYVYALLQQAVGGGLCVCLGWGWGTEIIIILPPPHSPSPQLKFTCFQTLDTIPEPITLNQSGDLFKQFYSIVPNSNCSPRQNNKIDWSHGKLKTLSLKDSISIKYVVLFIFISQNILHAFLNYILPGDQHFYCLSQAGKDMIELSFNISF